MNSFILKVGFPSFLILVLLDLNEFASSYFGTSGALTLVLLLLSVFLFIFSKPKVKIRGPLFKAFLWAVYIFFFLGAINSLFQGDFSIVISELRFYFPTVIIFVVTYRVCLSYFSREFFSQFVVIIAWLIGVNGVLILISVLFNVSFTNGSDDGIERAVGLYSNANRAGYVSVMGQACALFLISMDSKIIRRQAIYLYSIMLLAAISTFSKGAITVSILLAIRVVFTSNLQSNSFSGGSRKSIKVLTRFIVLSFIFLSIFFSQIKSNLKGQQFERITELQMLYSGEINDETTTQRSALGTYAWEEIKKNIVFGSGLKTFRKMEIGTGVHNTYLLIWGESGILSLIVYVIFLIRWWVLSKKIEHFSLKMLVSNIFLIFFLSGFAAHTLMSNKSYLVIMSTIFAGVDIFKWTKHK